MGFNILGVVAEFMSMSSIHNLIVCMKGNKGKLLLQPNYINTIYLEKKKRVTILKEDLEVWLNASNHRSITLDSRSNVLQWKCTLGNNFIRDYDFDAPYKKVKPHTFP